MAFRLGLGSHWMDLRARIYLSGGLPQIRINAAKYNSVGSGNGLESPGFDGGYTLDHLIVASVTYDLLNNIAYASLNGAEVQFSFDGTFEQTITSMYLGETSTPSDDAYRWGEIAILNFKPSSAEIVSYYNNGNGSSYLKEIPSSAKIGYWRFSESSGSTAFDDSSNALHLNLVNFENPDAAWVEF